MSATPVADFLEKFQATRTVVTLQQRSDLLAEYTQVERDIQVSMRDDLAGGAGVAALRERLHALEDEMRDAEFRVVLEALGSQRYTQLLALHPPTPDDRQQGLGFNHVTFPPALVAACAVDPVISPDEAEALCERLSDGQFTKLWNAALVVNIGDDSAPKSVRRSATVDPEGTS